MPVIGSNILAGASGQAAGGADVGTYTGKSCIFNGSNEFLNKTWGSAASDLDSFTISMWIKRGNTDSGSTQYWLVGALTGAESNIRIQADKIYVHLTGSNYDFTGTRLLRDVNSWYHLVFRYNSDEGSAGDRFRCYINGELETWASSSTIPSGTDNQFFANTNQITIGAYDASNHRFNGYIAQVCACDGQSLAPSSFAETSDDTGAWIMKEPLTGLTFGDNGFLLEFKQTGTGTASASTIGADTSGETNHLTSNNLVSGDSALNDTPVNNFCVFNSYNSVSGSISQGGRVVDGTDGKANFASFGVNSGKWYWEIDNTSAAYSGYVGVSSEGFIHSDTSSVNDGAFLSYVGGNGARKDYGATSSTADTDFEAKGVYGFELDMDSATKTLKYYIDGSLEHTDSSLPTDGTYVIPYILFTNSGVGGWGAHNANFGVPAISISSGNTDGNGHGNFEHAPSTGYLALCTKNLPEIEIGQEADDLAHDYFNTVIYTGNGSSGHSITGMGFSPDLLWIMPRSNGDNGISYDIARGTTKRIKLNSTDAEDTDGTALVTFESDGFDLDTTDVNFNGDTRTYAAWGWLAGTAVSGTTTGSGTGKAYSGQVNTDSGVSVITYLGNGSDNHTIPHHLGVAPDFVVSRRRTGSDAWYVFHTKNTSDPSSDYLRLNSTDATSDEDEIWSDSVPSSSVVTLGTNTGVNSDDVPYIMYSFASIEGFSKVGSYVGNNSNDGTFVYTGFEPAFTLIKDTGNSESWAIHDNKRSPINPMDDVLFANNNSSESANETDRAIDFVSNGFKLRGTDTGQNGSSRNYIFIAFSSGTGFKYGNAN
tara:strand:+ start:3355 stop:5817 length:2463 start_codon:yes stop_codon:yes gene_type:complete